MYIPPVTLGYGIPTHYIDIWVYDDEQSEGKKVKAGRVKRFAFDLFFKRSVCRVSDGRRGEDIGRRRRCRAGLCSSIHRMAFFV